MEVEYTSICPRSDWLPLYAPTRVLVYFVLPELATVEAHALISHTGTPAQVTCCYGLYIYIYQS